MIGKKLDKHNEIRRKIAKRYSQELDLEEKKTEQIESENPNKLN